MPTLIGAFFLIASLCCFARKDDTLFALAIFSSIFQGASVTSGGTFGLQPYYLVISIFVLQTMLDKRNRLGATSFRGKKALLVFGAIALISAFTLPVIFSGIPVYDKSIGIDDGLLYRPPLRFSLSNVSQAVFLAANILFVLSAARRPGRTDYLVKAFRFTFYFLVAVIVSQVLLSALNLEFPDWLFLNNPGYEFQDTHQGGISLRAPGTFSESSFAGAVLSMFCAAFLSEFLRNGTGILRALIAIMALFMVRSTSSFATVLVVVVLLVLLNPVMSGRGYIKVGKLVRLSLLFLSVGGSLAFVLFSPIGRVAILSVAEKGDSSSLFNRAAADLYALDVLVLSKGLGVGLGSNRPSSLGASLLSNTGIAGFLAFVVVFVVLVKNAKEGAGWLRWAALGLVIDMAFGVPDIGFAPLWMIFALTAKMVASHRPPSALSPGEIDGRIARKV